MIDALIDTVIHADCMEAMADMPDNYVDTVITDPPYGLSFMGKGWDHGVPGIPYWSECLRVAKPGAILMAFGGTRTYHRLTCAIEDAGWEIRDCIQWIYGSGFPKSLDISKAIDKAAGAEREVVGQSKHGACNKPNSNTFSDDAYEWERFHNITAPATPLAQQWDGWGTALKPSWEPIIVAMKPLDGTFAENAEKWGVAGLWIDGARIGHGDRRMCGTTSKRGETSYILGPTTETRTSQGRFPSNTILSCTCEDDHEPDCPVRMLDEQSGESQSMSGGKSGTTFATRTARSDARGGHTDSGGASRFFYCAKSSRAERNAGCEGMEEKESTKQFMVGMDNVEHSDGYQRANKPIKSTNHHPTVKPLALMEYLCKLTKTPTGGIVLDPFAGSGTTGLAAYRTGRQYILIEKEAEYAEIARARIQHEKDLMGLFE